MSESDGEFSDDVNSPLDMFKSVVQKFESDPEMKFDQERRELLIKSFCDSLESNLIGGTEGWKPYTIAKCIEALKCLGRSPNGTGLLVTYIPLFLRCAGVISKDDSPSDRSESELRSSTLPGKPSEEEESTKSFKIRHKTVQESLKITANTLLTHPTARESPSLIPAIGPLVRLALSPLPSKSSPAQHNAHDTESFLAARVLFLITTSQSELVVELVKNTDFVTRLEALFSREADRRKNPGATSELLPVSPSTLIECLKLLFNAMSHLQPSLEKLSASHHLRANDAVPSTLEGNRNDPKVERSAMEGNSQNAKDKSKANSEISGSTLEHEEKTKQQIFGCLLPHLVQLFLMEPIPSPPILKPPLASYIHCFVAFYTDETVFLSLSNILPPELRSEAEVIPPFILKLLEIADKVMERYDEPDELAARDKFIADGIDIDEELMPLFVNLVNILSKERKGMSEKCREALRQKIIPDDIDRSVGLHKQFNFIGRILRLISRTVNVHLQMLAGSFLELLYEGDKDRLSSVVGAGPLAGYFFSTGAPIINPKSEHQPPAGVNPITGALWSSNKEGGGEEEGEALMTEEEREVEVERLCRLFDEMNRNGIIKAEDPRKVAVESGKFVEIDERVRKELEDEEDKEEREALEEHEKYLQRARSKLK